MVGRKVETSNNRLLNLSSNHGGVPAQSRRRTSLPRAHRCQRCQTARSFHLLRTPLCNESRPSCNGFRSFCNPFRVFWGPFRPFWGPFRVLLGSFWGPFPLPFTRIEVHQGANSGQALAPANHGIMAVRSPEGGQGHALALARPRGQGRPAQTIGPRPQTRPVRLLVPNQIVVALVAELRP